MPNIGRILNVGDWVICRKGGKNCFDIGVVRQLDAYGAHVDIKGNGVISFVYYDYISPIENSFAIGNIGMCREHWIQTGQWV